MTTEDGGNYKYRQTDVKLKYVAIMRLSIAKSLSDTCNNPSVWHEETVQMI